jgi:hypothetical protein
VNHCRSGRCGSPSPAQQQRTVQEWNALYPIGTPVNVQRDNGTITQSKTRSAAWLMGGHTAMIMVDGIAGGYMLSRVTPQRV